MPLFDELSCWFYIRDVFLAGKAKHRAPYIALGTRSAPS